VNSQQAFDQLHQLLEAAKEGDIMRRYKRLPLLALFGHADRVGKARYNKKLSEARAKCMYGALVRKPQIWIDVFKSFNQTKYVKGRLKKDGYLTAGLGIKDAILQYMNVLCRSLQLKDADFVSGKGYQGCAAFNPVFVLPESEWKQLQGPKNKSRRDELNQVNRRVVGFLFKPDVPADNRRWFCKKYPDVNACAKHLVKGYRKRLGEKLAEPREFGKPGEAGETFACSFYEKLARSSPCEKAKRIPREVWKIRLTAFFNTSGGKKVSRSSVNAVFRFTFVLNILLEKPGQDWVVTQTDVVNVRTEVEPKFDPKVLKVLRTDYSNKAGILGLKGSSMDATVLWSDGTNPNTSADYIEISAHVAPFWNQRGMRQLNIRWPSKLWPKVAITNKIVASYNKQSRVKQLDGGEATEQLTLGTSTSELYAEGFLDRARAHVLPLVKTELQFRYKHEGNYWLVYTYSIDR
jgi:hypothetical protein